MTLAPPLLPQAALHKAELTIVKLSSLNETLKILVPDSDEFEANWDVYPILGADPDLPDWQGCKEPTGVWDDALEDMVKLGGLELHIPKAALEKYADSEVDLRYKFADESSLEPYSERLRLFVEA